MRRLLLLTFLLLLAASAWAQAPAWQWTTASAGAVDQSEIKRVLVDVEGSVIVLGQLKGAEATFGATTIRRRGKSERSKESFVAKLSAAGQWRWAVPLGSAFTGDFDDFLVATKITDVAVDADGNIVVCGIYADTLTLGAHTLLPIPRQQNRYARGNAFVASLDATGHWRWALTCDPATTSHAAVLGVAVDAAGYAYVIGFTSGQATFGGKALPEVWPVLPRGDGPYKFFVARVTPAGQWAWVVPLVDGHAKTDSLQANSVEAQQIAVDRAGNVCVAGFFWGTLSLGPSTLTSTRTLNTPSSPLPSIFVAKLSAAGRWRWAAQASHSVPAYHTYHGHHNIRWGDNSTVSALTVGRSGQLYLSGRYEDGLTLTPQRRAATRRPPLPDEGAFVASLSRRGRWRWIRVAPENHRRQTGTDACLGIAIDPTAGDVLATGIVYGATAFDPATPIPRQLPKRSIFPTLFLARFTAAGSGQGSHDQWSEWGDDTSANAVAVGSKGEVYVAGNVSEECWLNSGGRVRHCFVARLNPARRVSPRGPR